jgi:glutathione synthase/RimK-type ligase-like ATP-grasp enzyme
MNNMKKSPQIIGRKVHVQFPLYGLVDIPAKIDTGADSSSIWASDIKEENGVLSFRLFDKTSPLFTGELITTRDYKIISVKNSFGVAEYRYKVKLPVVMEGRKMQALFTLADRSRNSHPILIGRKTLRGKFIVDVSKDSITDSKQRILIISARQSTAVQTLAKGIAAQMENTEIDVTTYDDIIFSIVDGESFVTIQPTGKDIASYDIVHFKTSIQRDITAAIARYASFKGVRVLDKVVESFPTTSKLYQYSILANNSIRVPDSVFVTPKRLSGSYQLFVDTLSLPFVLKDIHASKGQLNEVIRSEEDFARVAAQAVREEKYLIGQAFVPNEGDYRVLVLGKQISLVIHRMRRDDTTHLNNTSTGGAAKLIAPADLPAQVQIDSIHAAALMERDIAGVDIVQDTVTKVWYCFEVNDGPQIATGSFLKEKQQALAAYFQRELDK